MSFADLLEKSDFVKDQSVTSKNTSINGNKLPKVFTLVESKYGWEPDTINLDIGGGRYDNATEYLKAYKVDNLIFDPFNRSEDHNNSVLSTLLERKADTVTLSNVLCVIPERDIQDRLLQMAFDHLRPGGILYLTVYEGDRTGNGRMTGKDQWQEHRRIRDYLGQVNRVFGVSEVKYGMIRAIKECI